MGLIRADGSFANGHKFVRERNLVLLHSQDNSCSCDKITSSGLSPEAVITAYRRLEALKTRNSRASFHRMPNHRRWIINWRCFGENSIASRRCYPSSENVQRASYEFQHLYPFNLHSDWIEQFVKRNSKISRKYQQHNRVFKILDYFRIFLSLSFWRQLWSITFLDKSSEGSWKLSDATVEAKEKRNLERAITRKKC